MQKLLAFLKLAISGVLLTAYSDGTRAAGSPTSMTPGIQAICPQPPRHAFENGSVAIQVETTLPAPLFASLNLVEMTLNGTPQESQNPPVLLGMNGETVPNARELLCHWSPAVGEIGLWEFCFESQSTTGDSVLHCASVAVSTPVPWDVRWEPRVTYFDPMTPATTNWHLRVTVGLDETILIELPFLIQYLAGAPPLIDTLVGGVVNPEDTSDAGSDILFPPELDICDWKSSYPFHPQTAGGADSLLIAMDDWAYEIPAGQYDLQLRVKPLGVEGIVSIDTATMDHGAINYFQIFHWTGIWPDGYDVYVPTYSPGCFPLISRINLPPSVLCPVASLGTRALGELITLPGFSFDDPDGGPGPYAFQIVSMTKDGLSATPTHAPVIGGDTFAWQTSDASSQDLGVWEFCVVSYDGVHTSEDTCCFTVEMAEFAPVAAFSFGCVEDVLTGATVCVPLELHNLEPCLELGGFDLLFSYDASALTFQGLDLEGSVLVAAGWEYFTYRIVATNPPLIRIVAIADMNNSGQHPNSLCLDGLIASVCFRVTNDQNAGCRSTPLQWYWQNCGDNTASDPTGDTLYIITDPYGGISYAGGDPLAVPQVPGGGIVVYSCHVDAQLATFDGGATGPGGFPCLDADTTKPDPVPRLSFENGKVTIICPGDIDDRGDLNLNGLGYEIADAVLYSNYHISGPAVFTVSVAGQTAASDVNADGSALTVADLVYLIRVLSGDALPISGDVLGGGPKLAAMEGTLDVTASQSGQKVGISTSSAQDLGAVLFVFRVEGTEVRSVEPLGRASQMDVIYAANGGELRVLVYNIQDRARIAAGSGDILSLTTAGSGSVELLSVEAASFMGGRLDAAVAARTLPSDFRLNQNSPNPFNPSTSLSVEFPRASDYRLTIFNIAGQTVKSYSGSSEAGTLTLTWDGRDSQGHRVATGVYLYSVEAGEFRDVKRMLLLK